MILIHLSLLILLFETEALVTYKIISIFFEVLGLPALNVGTFLFITRNYTYLYFYYV